MKIVYFFIFILILILSGVPDAESCGYESPEPISVNTYGVK